MCIYVFNLLIFHDPGTAVMKIQNVCSISEILDLPVYSFKNYIMKSGATYQYYIILFNIN